MSDDVAADLDVQRVSAAMKARGYSGAEVSYGPAMSVRGDAGEPENITLGKRTIAFTHEETGFFRGLARALFHDIVYYDPGSKTAYVPLEYKSLDGTDPLLGWVWQPMSRHRFLQDIDGLCGKPRQAREPAPEVPVRQLLPIRQGRFRHFLRFRR